MKIILIRHVQTEKNKEGILMGRRDSELTDKGKEQISRIAELLKKEKISAVYCSGLGRALKTAESISKAYNLTTKIDERLTELDWGDFSNLPSKEVIATWASYYKGEKKRGVPRENIRPPHGENSFDHAKRVQDFIEQIKERHKNETIAIIGHSGTNKVFIGVLKKIDPERFYEIKQDNGCMNYLELDKEGNLISAEINSTVHLAKK